MRGRFAALRMTFGGLVPVCAGDGVAGCGFRRGRWCGGGSHDLFQLITQNGVLFVENVGCHDHLAGHARPIPCCFDAEIDKMNWIGP